MLRGQNLVLLEPSLGPLQTQTKEPGKYLRRCVDTLSFEETGHESWTRELQVRIPGDLATLGEAAPAVQVVSIGLFERMRYPDLKVFEDGDPVPLLTRDEHAWMMSRIWSAKFLVPEVRRNPEAMTTEQSDAADRFASGLDAYFYSPQPSARTAKLQQVLRRLLNELISLGVFRNEVTSQIRNPSVPEPTGVVFDRMLGELALSTQVLCWLPVDAKRPLRNIRIEYSKSEVVKPSDLATGDEGRNLWFQELDPISPVVVRVRSNMVHHCQTYYFRLRPARGSRPLVAGWELPKSDRDRWSSVSPKFAAAVALSHDGYSASNDELTASALGYVPGSSTGASPAAPDQVEEATPRTRFSRTRRLIKEIALDPQFQGLLSRGEKRSERYRSGERWDRTKESIFPGLSVGLEDFPNGDRLADSEPANEPLIRLAVGATNEYLPALGFAACFGLFYFLMRAAVLADESTKFGASDGLGMTALLVFAAVQLLAYIQFRREDRVAHGSYVYSTKIWVFGGLVTFLALFAASPAPLKFIAGFLDMFFGLEISTYTQSVIMKLGVGLGASLATTVIVYSVLTSMPTMAKRRMKYALDASRLLDREIAEGVRSQCLTHMSVIATPVDSGLKYQVFRQALRRTAWRVRNVSLASGFLCLVASIYVVSTH